MNEKELELAERLIGTLGENAGATIDAYVVWFVVSSLGWVAFGAAFCFVAYRVMKMKPGKNGDISPVAYQIFAAVLAIIGSIVVMSNLPDLAAPRAMAIHQLLKDIVP